jgi:hypothetical protein
MDGAWLHRLRWRLTGAWLWPAFVVTAILDAFVGHLLPPAGETQSLAAAAVLALILNVVAVLLLSRPLGAVFRRARGDAVPWVVARDYGGAVAVVLVAAAVLVAGLAHRSHVVGNQRAAQEAVARAQSWIGEHAPEQFRAGVAYTNTYAIQEGSIYRTCVVDNTGAQDYCVIVKLAEPSASSVSFGGTEPNSLFSQGTN